MRTNNTAPTLDFAVAWKDAENRLAADDPFFAHREPQADCARLIHEALFAGNHAAIDAPTGSGKSYAALIAAQHLPGRVVISTATRALQAQFRDKDIPVLQRLGILTRTVAVLDGRNRWLCQNRVKHSLHGAPPAVRPHLRKLQDLGSDAGLRDTLPIAVPDDVWSRSCSDKDACKILDCTPLTCAYLRAREEARAADIVVVNHSLLLADAAVKAGRPDAWGRTGNPVPPTTLGPYQHLIVDEAHALEAAAESFAQRQVTVAGVHALATRLTRIPGLTGARNHLLDVETEILAAVADLPHDCLVHPTGEHLLAAAVDAAGAAVTACTSLSATLPPGPDANRVLLLRAACKGLHDRLKAVDAALATGTDDIGLRAPSATLGTRGKPSTGILTSQLVDASPWLDQYLFRWVPTVLLSATLAVPGRPDHVPRRLGLTVPVVCLPTTFDLARQRLVYVTPRADIPASPARVGFDDVDELRALIHASRGRALVLFPAHADLRFVHDELVAGPPLGHTLLAQGVTVSSDGARGGGSGGSAGRSGGSAFRPGVLAGGVPPMPVAALARLFTSDTSSVLLATRSFFEGVDFPGSTCSLVVVARFPNLRPDDPLTLARRLSLEARGLSAWSCYSEPAMHLLFRQAAGRAIRSCSDVGVVAVLDPRCGSKVYARRALVALRPSDFVDSVVRVSEFLS